jgi:hypothetical protein
MDDWPDDEPDDQRPRRASEIGPTELFDALKALAGFSDNPALVTQGQQLALVDNLLNSMEEQTLHPLSDVERPMAQFALLGALSPMWIYAAYELLRTWRQRCEEVVRLASSGGFDLKAEHLEREKNYHHYDRKLRAEQLRMARDNPEIVQRMKDDLARTEMGFTIIEFIRVALAKHEVSSKAKKKPIAFAPGLALPDRHTGSMVYELSTGGSIIGFHSRRDLAETIRGLPTAPIPRRRGQIGF